MQASNANNSVGCPRPTVHCSIVLYSVEACTRCGLAQPTGLVIEIVSANTSQATRDRDTAVPNTSPNGNDLLMTFRPSYQLDAVLYATSSLVPMVLQ